MARKPDVCLVGSHTRRSPALAFLGALSLGLALLVICLGLLTVPSPAEAKRHALREVGVSVASLSEPYSGQNSLQNTSAILSRNLAWSLLEMDGTRVPPHSAIVVTDTKSQTKSLPSTPTLDGPTLVPYWFSDDNDDTRSVAWGDMDGDGDLDLAVGNGDDLFLGAPNKVYLNVDGVLQTTAAWSSADSDYTQSVAWGDMDGDGDLDLAAGNHYIPSKVYLSGRPAHPLQASNTIAIALDSSSDLVRTQCSLPHSVACPGGVSLFCRIAARPV